MVRCEAPTCSETASQVWYMNAMSGYARLCLCADHFTAQTRSATAVPYIICTAKSRRIPQQLDAEPERRIQARAR